MIKSFLLNFLNKKGSIEAKLFIKLLSNENCAYDKPMKINNKVISLKDSKTCLLVSGKYTTHIKFTDYYIIIENFVEKLILNHLFNLKYKSLQKYYKKAEEIAAENLKSIEKENQIRRVQEWHSSKSPLEFNKNLQKHTPGAKFMENPFTKHTLLMFQLFDCQNKELYTELSDKIAVEWSKMTENEKKLASKLLKMSRLLQKSKNWVQNDEMRSEIEKIIPKVNRNQFFQWN